MNKKLQLYLCELCGEQTSLVRFSKLDPEEGQVCEICARWYCNNCERLPYRNDDTYLAVCRGCYKEDMNNIPYYI